MVGSYAPNELLHENGKDRVRISPEEVRVGAYIDGKYELLVDHLVDPVLENKTFLMLTKEIPLKRLMDEESMEKFRTSGFVEFHFTSYVIKKLHFENLTAGGSGEQEHSSRQFHFTVRLKREENGMPVAILVKDNEAGNR
jgi:hypothetical protein